MPWSLQSRLQMLWSAVSALDLPMVPSRVILPQMTLEIRHEEKGWQAGQVRHCLDGWWLARMVGQWGGLKYSIKQPFSLIDVWILSQTLDSYGFMPACMSLLGRDARARWPFSSFSIWGAKCQQVGTCSELRIYCAEKQRSILHSAWWLWLCDREKKIQWVQHPIQKYCYLMDRSPHPAKCHTTLSPPAAQWPRRLLERPQWRNDPTRECQSWWINSLLLCPEGRHGWVPCRGFSSTILKFLAPLKKCM